MAKRNFILKYKRDSQWETIRIRTPPGVSDLFIVAVARIAKEYPLSGDTDIRYGQALEILSANYLAGP